MRADRNGNFPLRNGFSWITMSLVVSAVWMTGCEVSDKRLHHVIPADFYVAPDGQDTNPGTANAPFASVSRARSAARQRIAAGLTHDILILIRGGTYQQAETLLFGPEDSGTEKNSVTYAAYPHEKVIFSGGRRITGWTRAMGGIWTAQIPEVKAGQWYFRQLFINGRRAVRARTPNPDDPMPWWIIRTSTQTENEDQPFMVTINGPVITWTHPDDMELVCIYNNEGGRKRLQSVDVEQQTLTVAPPHKWNPRCFGNDWYLSAPTAGKACYLENAPEMLDRPGEWYLDRTTGILSYWPRGGEDLNRDEVMAPFVQNTLLAITGTREHPVVNLHFRGIQLEYVDWPLPTWGYNGLFSCNVAVGSQENPSHRFIEAAVDLEHALSCDFVEGGIAHVGGMGLCLRDGTASNRIEGNEIWDLGGGGIGAGGGYFYGVPFTPAPGEYQGYRIANNYVHHCGLEYYGGSGICLYRSQDSTLSHNLVHDCAYFGMCAAGDWEKDTPFSKNNRIESNHIYHSMKVTVDGAGLYVTLYNQNTLVRNNLIHDTLWNPFGRGEIASGIHDTIPCHGLYLDGNNTGCIYENNIVYRNAGGPLLFNSAKSRNQWVNNLFQKDGTPPDEFIEVMQACTGLEPAYRQSIRQKETNPCIVHPMTSSGAPTSCTACQYDLPQKRRGVVAIFLTDEEGPAVRVVKLHGLDPLARYETKKYTGTLAKVDHSFFEGTFFGNSDKNLRATCLAALGDLPILSNIQPAQSDMEKSISGLELMEQGVKLKRNGVTQIIWITYEKGESVI